MASLIRLEKKATNVATISVKEWVLVKTDGEYSYFASSLSADSAVLRVLKNSHLITFKKESPVGELIRSHMEQKGLSQNELALKSSVSQMTISNILSGACESVNSNTLDLIANALGISADQMFEACKSNT